MNELVNCRWNGAVRAYVAALVVGVAACSSPTSFDTVSNVVLTVESTVAVTHGAEAISAPLTVQISNRGSSTTRFLEVCGLGFLVQNGEPLFSTSRPCALRSSVTIAPGAQEVAFVDATAARGEWPDPVGGEYTLRLGLFVEGRERAQLVESTPFRIGFGQ